MPFEPPWYEAHTAECAEPSDPPGTDTTLEMIGGFMAFVFAVAAIAGGISLWMWLR